MLSSLNRTYYSVKPFFPETLTLALRRQYLNHQLERCSDTWPINESAGINPPGWRGWPDGKKFALVLTHDVESADGVKKSYDLMQLEMEMGFRSCFNFVAEGYGQDGTLRRLLLKHGFEIGLHGLIHRGNLFMSRETFEKQLPSINKYIKEWKVKGFRTPSMYHNLEWIHELDIEYDSSTFDTDPFEPQPDGVKKIFPFWVEDSQRDRGYVELPYTMPQDFTLFILMQEKDDRIWRKKLDWVAQRGGLALFIVHPDYLSFSQDKTSIKEYPVEYYRNFLTYVKERYKDRYWQALPQDVARFWVENYSHRHKTALADGFQQLHPKRKESTSVMLADPAGDPRWDEFVENHPFGWITHLSGWKTTLETSFPHMKGYYFALVNEDERNRRIRAILPVFDVNSWFLGRRLVSIPFATLCDPLFTSDDDLGKLLSQVVDYCGRLKTLYLEIRSHKASANIQDQRFCCMKFYKHHFITLDKEIDELKKTFHRTNVRQRIQRAQNSQLTLKSAESEADLLEFYRLHKLSRKRLCLPPQPYIFFKQLWMIFYPLNYLTLLIAQKDGQSIAALILLKFRDRVSAEFLATDNNYTDLSPNHLLFWEAIKAAREEGFRTFDFGRTSPLNASLMRFKDRWGTTVVDLPHFVYPDNANEDVANRETSRSYRISRLLCQYAPDPFYSLMGRFCYRHLG